MITELIELTAFELEYQHRAKSNPFSEKWKNCTRTRSRGKRLKTYLYTKVSVILCTNYREKFYDIALEPFFHHSLAELLKSLKPLNELKNIKDVKQFPEGPEGEEESATPPVDILYRVIFYRMSLDDLFILLTNVIAWEHQNYPALLENAIFQEFQIHGNKVANEDLFRYYLRFLDVLSSSEIISLFDLDALKFTVKTDCELIGEKPLNRLHLFTDWPTLNTEPFHRRFPQFKENLDKKMAQMINLEGSIC